MKRQSIALMVTIFLLAFVLAACGDGEREIDIGWLFGGEQPPSEIVPTPEQTAPPEVTLAEFTDMPVPSTEIPLPPPETPYAEEVDAEYSVYQPYEILDPAFSSMVAYRTLLPEGWTAQGGVDWYCNSADAPAQIWITASSPDGAAFFCSASDQWYAMQYTYGTPTQPWGYTMREPLSAEQAALEYLTNLNVMDTVFTGYFDADTDGSEWAETQTYLAQLEQNLAMYQQELQNPYFEHIVFEGTGTLDGYAYDVRAEASVLGYRSYSDSVIVDYCVVTGVAAYLAPEGQMPYYIGDMLDIQANGITNQNWLTGRQQVSTEIWAILRQQQAAEWAWAREMSAQLSAQVDATIAHTNAWIASTDATMFNNSANWSDYIFDQNNYAGIDGGTVSVPTSYEHVWQGDDGSIYASNYSDLFDNPNTNPNSTTYYTELELVN